jgi:hypothetical protein
LRPDLGLSRAVLAAIVLYAALALVFTGVGVYAAPGQAQVGGPRPLGLIPLHVAELVAFGMLLGAVPLLMAGKKALPLTVLIPILVVLLDLDHLPAYLGWMQPIRPAHSLFFALTAVVLAAIVLRRMDIELALMAAFMGHMGVDNGLFPPFSPISYYYVQVDPYRIPLLLGAVLLSIWAGVALRRVRREE